MVACERPTPGCGKYTSFWVARRKKDPRQFEFGNKDNSVLHCGFLDRSLNHDSWNFLCKDCAVKAGWIW